MTMTSSVTMKIEVSSYLSVTDLRFCWVVSRVGFLGLSPPSPWVVASNVTAWGYGFG